MSSPLRQLRREAPCRPASMRQMRNSSAPRPAILILGMIVALCLATLLVRALAALIGTA